MCNLNSIGQINAFYFDFNQVFILNGIYSNRYMLSKRLNVSVFQFGMYLFGTLNGLHLDHLIFKGVDINRGWD